jgi:hypothetical protein
MKQPIYKLKELIDKKYGTENFESAYNTIAELLRSANDNFWIAEDVKELCAITELTMKFSFDEGTKLMKHFELREPEDLFNYPEHIKFSSGFENRCGYECAEEKNVHGT